MAVRFRFDQMVMDLFSLGKFKCIKSVAEKREFSFLTARYNLKLDADAKVITKIKKMFHIWYYFHYIIIFITKKKWNCKILKKNITFNFGTTVTSHTQTHQHISNPLAATNQWKRPKRIAFAAHVYRQQQQKTASLCV